MLDIKGPRPEPEVLAIAVVLAKRQVRSAYGDERPIQMLLHGVTMY